MKLPEAMQMLEEIAEFYERVGVDTNQVDVVMATQEGFPLSLNLKTITGENPADGMPRVWLAEGSSYISMPHAPRVAWSDDVILEPQDKKDY